MDHRSAALFHHHLATMLDAGIALPDAIETAGRGTAGRWPQITAEWAAARRAGQPLSSVAGDSLGSVDLALIAAGEASGDLRVVPSRSPSGTNRFGSSSPHDRARALPSDRHSFGADLANRGAVVSNVVPASGNSHRPRPGL